MQIERQDGASSKGLGFVLLQDGRPITYSSRALTTAEQYYSQIERELLAQAFEMEQNRKWGHSFSTCAQRREGVKQKRTPCVQEGGGLHMEYVRKNVPFCTCFVIFSYAGSFYHTLLSLA